MSNKWGGIDIFYIKKNAFKVKLLQTNGLVFFEIAIVLDIGPLM